MATDTSRRVVRVGVIGAGAWAVTNHLPTLAARDDVELVGVSRMGADELSRVRDDWGFAVASEDYRDVLAAGVDACVIASPASLHHEHARAALESGAHVLVEKPFTVKPRDAWDLVELARSLDRHLVVSFGWNFRPMARHVRDLLSGRALGALEHLELSMSSPMRDLFLPERRFEYAEGVEPDSRTWNDPALAGGGYGQAQLTHGLGLALWLTGLRASEVGAFLGYRDDATVELHNALAIRYENGAVGTVSGYSAHGDEFRVELRAVGATGQLHAVFEVGRERIALVRDRHEDQIELPLYGDGEYDCMGPPHALIDLALGRNVENSAPGELGARTVELLDAAYRSGRTGRSERVGDA